MGGFNFVLGIIIYKVLFFLWIIELGYLVDFIIMVLYVYNFCFVKENKLVDLIYCLNIVIFLLINFYLN